MKKVNFEETFKSTGDLFGPNVVGEANGKPMSIGRFRGPFSWKSNNDEDDILISMKGRHRIELRNETLWLNEGEVIIIPKGTEYRPVIAKEVEVLSF